MTGDSNKSKGSGFWSELIGKVILVVLIIVSLAYALQGFLNVSSNNRVASIAIFFGIAVSVSGSYELVYLLPNIAKEAKMGVAAELETRVIMWGAKGCFCMVMFGLLFVLLGVLKLLGILPWW